MKQLVEKLKAGETVDLDQIPPSLSRQNSLDRRNPLARRRSLNRQLSQDRLLQLNGNNNNNMPMSAASTTSASPHSIQPPSVASEAPSSAVTASLASASQSFTPASSKPIKAKPLKDGNVIPITSTSKKVQGHRRTMSVRQKLEYETIISKLDQQIDRLAKLRQSTLDQGGGTKASKLVALQYHRYYKDTVQNKELVLAAKGRLFSPLS